MFCLAFHALSLLCLSSRLVILPLLLFIVAFIDRLQPEAHPAHRARWWQRAIDILVAGEGIPDLNL
ncbi:MAG: hypothetical protein H0W02_10180 [Ktedonobacteraceae bacterium]|nr:hypothetical protein [Ktedonobacteraceae bacterium]